MSGSGLRPDRGALPEGESQTRILATIQTFGETGFRMAHRERTRRTEKPYENKTSRVFRSQCQGTLDGPERASRFDRFMAANRAIISLGALDGIPQQHNITACWHTQPPKRLHEGRSTTLQPGPQPVPNMQNRRETAGL